MIQFTNVKKIYESNLTEALYDISFVIEDGEFVFLVGPSGSGKSTILKLLTAEERITSGGILVGDFDLARLSQRKVPYLRRTLGVVFQDYRLIENRTVKGNLEFAMRVVGTRKSVIRERIPYVLELVGLSEKGDCYPSELSGGEQQRVAIARALVNNPKTIIADEPTGNLDPERSYELMCLLEKINQLGTTMLVVTHERDLVNCFNKRVISIDSGRVISDMENGLYDYDTI
ncbi:MAG: ATP-binding cassette domain-containing protein [Clostridiales bacterium]|nr:ATP-binding cassette domain-containing protein [Clostridiales bacterium]